MKKFGVFLSFLLISSFGYAKNVVITSIQPLYSLTSYLVRGTNIEVCSVFDSDVSMTMSYDAINDKDFKLDVAKKSQAVVDIAKVWKEDIIYGKARSRNINIIEIDASYSYAGNTVLFYNKYSNGEFNPFIWTGSRNIIKMAHIISSDLKRIFPKSQRQIGKNLIAFTNKIVEMEKISNKRLLKCNRLEVISLSENLQYLLNDLNIYTEYINYSFVTKENIREILKKTGIKTLVSDKWLKKDILKILKEEGVEFVMLDTLDIPYDIDGKMDKDAILKAYQHNVNVLVEALSK